MTSLSDLLAAPADWLARSGSYGAGVIMPGAVGPRAPSGVAEQLAALAAMRPSGSPVEMVAPAAGSAAVRAPRRAANRSGGKTLVVGDSLGVGTVPYLRKQGVRVDANVVGGRSSADGVSALAQKLRGGRYDRIVLDLGTNDGSAGQLVQSVRRAQKLAPGAQIYVPTVNGPQAAAKNAALRKLAGVTLVNWAMQSGGLLAPDGIHASGVGYARRAEILRRSLRA